MAYPDFVFPEMFGAVGDGVANDTAAFVSALASGKSLMLMPARVYLVDNLTLPDVTGLEIRGFGSTIKKRSGGDSHYLAASGNYLANLNYTQVPVRIENVIFDAAGLAENALILQSWNSDIMDVDCTGATHDGLLLTAKTRDGTALSSSLVNNRFKVRCHGNGHYGFHCLDGTRNKATDGTIFPGSKFYDNGGYGIQVDAGAGWEIASARTYNNGGGIAFNGVGIGTRIHDCYIDDGIGALGAALPTGEDYSAAVICSAHLSYGTLPVRSCVVTGPITSFGSGDTAPYGIWSESNQYRGDAHLLHQYWGDDHISFSLNDVFDTATPFRWHNGSSPGLMNVRNSHKLSNSKWVNGRFAATGDISAYEST